MTEHLLKIPEGVVREVLGGSDRVYDLPEGTPKELEMRIGWAKIGSGEAVEEEVLNGIFAVSISICEGRRGGGAAAAEEGNVGAYGRRGFWLRK